MIYMVLATDMAEHQVCIWHGPRHRYVYIYDMVLANDMAQHQVIIARWAPSIYSQTKKKGTLHSGFNAVNFENLYQRIVSLLKQEMPSRLEAAHTKVTDNGTDEGGHGAANTRANCVTRLDTKGLSLMVCAGEMRICYVSNTFLNLEGRQQCIQWCIQRCIQRCILDAACR